MARHRYDLTDAEWKIIGLLPTVSRRGPGRRTSRLNGIFWPSSCRATHGQLSAKPLPSRLTTVSCAGGRPVSGGNLSAISEAYAWSSSSDRLDPRRPPPPPAGLGDCIGRSRGGNTTKIHALVAERLADRAETHGWPRPTTASRPRTSRSMSGERCCSPTVATTAMPFAETRRAGRANIRPLEHRIQAEVQSESLQAAQPRRALLQQTQALSSYRHAILPPRTNSRPQSNLLRYASG